MRRKVTRWVILQEARPQTLMSLLTPIVLGLLVGTRFQVLFHSPRRGAFHLSLTVLVHYRSPVVFSLGRWTSRFRTGLACPVLLRCSTQACRFCPTGLSPSTVRRSRPVRVSNTFLTCCLAAVESYNPNGHVRWFGLLRVRSPLLAESSLFLRILGCFGSPGALPRTY